MLRARFAILLICSLCAAAMAQEPNGLRFTAPERSVQMRGKDGLSGTLHNAHTSPTRM